MNYSWASPQTATLETEESAGRCGEVAVTKR